MKTYRRVVPRDFFNESKLLKCLGAFMIEAERYDHIKCESSCEPFEIELNDSAELSVTNYYFYCASIELRLFTPYNSKEPYPLYADVCDEVGPFSVFSDDGKFTTEFVDFIKAWRNG
jgi:hypothetical protein